jgi:hypothetical protein
VPHNYQHGDKHVIQYILSAGVRNITAVISLRRSLKSDHQGNGTHQNITAVILAACGLKASIRQEDPGKYAEHR